MASSAQRASGSVHRVEALDLVDHGLEKVGEHVYQAHQFFGELLHHVGQADAAKELADLRWDLRDVAAEKGGGDLHASGGEIDDGLAERADQRHLGLDAVLEL